MVRKKSIASKVKTRKERYKRKSMCSNAHRLWRILILIIKAVRIFLSNRRNAFIAAPLPSNFEALEPCFSASNCISFTYKKVITTFPKTDDIKARFIDLKIIQDVLKKLVSKISRREYERIRQTKLREKLKEERKKNSFSIENRNANTLDLKKSIQCIRYKQKYRENMMFRKQKSASVVKYFRRKYMSDKNFHERHNDRVRNKYLNNSDLYEKQKIEVLNKYHTDKEFREKHKCQARTNYESNNQLRQKRIARIKAQAFNKYHNNVKFRTLCIVKARETMLKKYHENEHFRTRYKRQMKEEVLSKYRTNSLKRLKMIHQALNHYRMNYTPMKQTHRRLYNKKKRIMKKYISMQSHICKAKHLNLYMKHLKRFRELNSEGPDYVCISCRLALFRSQVIPYMENKYTKKKKSYEIKEKIQSYINDSSMMNKSWICKYCSDKMKRDQIPSRAVANKLEIKEIPSELKKLNNLETHLIALRLPFLKIINLSSGKMTGKFAQKGTKGPLHCVPSNVMETITTLPRPIDKSMMVRLQLKRRLKYKTVWEEQLINPNDVRSALITLTKIHPGYKKHQHN